MFVFETAENSNSCGSACSETHRRKKKRTTEKKSSGSSFVVRSLGITPLGLFKKKHRGVVRCRSVVRLVLLLEEKNPKNRCFLLFVLFFFSKKRTPRTAVFCCSSCSETHRFLSLEESQEKKEPQEPLFSVVSSKNEPLLN